MKKIYPAMLAIAASFFASCGLRAPAYDFSPFDSYLPVDFHVQKDDTTCGLSAIEMIADYYGKTLDARFAGLLLKEARLTKGIQAASLKACLEASGFDVAVFPGTMDHGTAGIYRHLALKRPLIVLISAKPGESGHYLVVNGYKGESLLAAVYPEKGQSTADLKWFMPLWKNAGFLTLLALPGDK